MSHTIDQFTISVDPRQVPPSTQLKMVGPKLHGIKVTEAKLNYHGSVTIDSDILEAAGLLPMEFVYIWNKNSGTRISTYVLPGERGSGVCCLNGAAARSCQVGDEVIITSERMINFSDIQDYQTRVLTFLNSSGIINAIADKLQYQIVRVKSPDSDSNKVGFQFTLAEN